MKTKKFNKKLSLNKSTVTHLTDGELTKAHGGYIPTDYNDPANTCLGDASCYCTRDCTFLCSIESCKICP